MPGHSCPHQVTVLTSRGQVGEIAWTHRESVNILASDNDSKVAREQRRKGSR